MSYDEEGDILYVDFRDEVPDDHVAEAGDGVLLSLDETGAVVAVEVRNFLARSGNDGRITLPVNVPGLLPIPA